MGNQQDRISEVVTQIGRRSKRHEIREQCDKTLTNNVRKKQQVR